MAFKPIFNIYNRCTCRDFKSFFFNREYCKYSFKCANAGNQYITRRHYDARGLFDLMCTRIEKDDNMKADPNMPEMRDQIKKR